MVVIATKHRENKLDLSMTQYIEAMFMKLGMWAEGNKKIMHIILFLSRSSGRLS